MPVTDLSGDDDWLQQFLAGHQAGQAFGASQPYGPQGAPGPYSGGPQAWMPGGALMGRQQTTPGAPSMGYPAMGQPGAQQPPAAAPGPAQGLSLTSNPVSNWLRNNVSIGAPNFANISPEAAHDLAVTKQKLGGVLNAAAQGQPTNSADLVGAGDTSLGSIMPQARGVAVPGSPAAPTTADPAARGGSGYGGVPPSGWGSSPASAATRPLPARPVTPTPRTAYVGQQPGTGAPAGNPSQTPATPQGAQSGRFGTSTPFASTFQYQAPNSIGSRAPIYTALNLFGGGQQPAAQPAANPANVPAPNAQAVSGALGPSGMSKAPWWMGPFQPNAFGPPTPDQIAGRGLKQRYG